MHSSPQATFPTAADLADLDWVQLLALVRSQAQTIAHLQHQLDWFKRQLFGAKSERFIAPDPLQMHLGEALPLLSARRAFRRALWPSSPFPRRS